LAKKLKKNNINKIREQLIIATNSRGISDE